MYMFVEMILNGKHKKLICLHLAVRPFSNVTLEFWFFFKGIPSCGATLDILGATLDKLKMKSTK